MSLPYSIRILVYHIKSIHLELELDTTLRKRDEMGRTFVLGYCEDNNSSSKTYKILSFSSSDSKDGSKI